jgi:hypothetical protein
VTLCAVAHGFLALRRALFPPEQSEMDAAHGPSASAASAPDAHRLVSNVRPAHRRALPAESTVTALSSSERP